MSRRHEDRSPRTRSKKAPGGKDSKPEPKRPSSWRKVVKKKAPRKKAPPKPKKPAPPKREPGKSSTGKSSTGKPTPVDKAPLRRPTAGRAGGSKPPRTSRRRQQGLVVTPVPSKVAVDEKVRLNQYLARCGVCSRRAADGFIKAGRVEINGKVVRELGTRVDPARDEVRFDDKALRPEKSVYVLFNKPTGVVCTNARHEQKKRVIDFLPTVKGRLFTVGRLDLDSEGLILLTNDGPFALVMTHPRYGVPKLYHVVLRGRLSQDEIGKARGGVWLAEGPTSGMQVRVTRTTRDRSYLTVTLREGKNREIRRVFAKLGYPVISLKRVRIGDLSLHGLGVGKWRFLQLHEIQELRRLASGEGLPAEENS